MTVGIDDSTDPNPEAIGPERIPFNRPSIEGREMELIRSAVEPATRRASGPFSRRAGRVAPARDRRARRCC